jgi:hypothetical protein
METSFSQEHELIHDIVYNNQTLALMIKDSFSNMIHVTDFIRHRSSCRSWGYFPATLQIGHVLPSLCSYI